LPGEAGERGHSRGLRYCVTMLILVLWLALSSVAMVAGQTYNKEIKRKIEVKSQIARITTSYSATGVDGEYVFGLPMDKEQNLSYLRARVDGKDLPLTHLPLEAGRDFALYSVDPSSRTDRSNLELEVLAVYTDVVRPYPLAIRQTERQLVRFDDYLHVPSPYTTGEQTTSVILGSLGAQNTESYTQEKVQDRLIFGPYLEVAPWSTEPLFAHYVLHVPFAKATECLREIEVSAWGNIAVEEHYNLEHAGAKLVGGFNRVDYSKGGYKQSTPSFRTLTGSLPLGARDIYYRDNIGNVSTSAVADRDHGVDLSIQTRYPLYGGWQTAWYQGYNLPTKEGLRHQGASYELQLQFGVPFSVMWVEDLTVKVVLPEGAKDVKVSVPFELDDIKEARRFTYLDSPLLGGRPVVILRKHNVVSDHNINVTVTYTFERLFMLQEPLLLVLMYFGFFLIFMAMYRFDTRIRK
ncbi:unnamed protein product, partial [Chrysoparadoxa australica]